MILKLQRGIFDSQQYPLTLFLILNYKDKTMSLVLNCQSQFAAKLTCGFMLHDYLETMEVIERTLSLYCTANKGLKGTVVNRVCNTLNGVSFEVR